MKLVRIVLGISLAAGAAMLVGAGLSVMNTRKFLSTAESAGGVVVSNVWRTDSDGDGVYYPRVRFQTRTGQTIEFVSQIGSSPASYAPNTAVEVVYDPQDPSHARIRAFWSLYLLPFILGVIGTVFTGAGAVVGLLRLRSMSRTRWLQRHGEKILADFTGVEMNTQIEVGDKHPYRIVCRWQHPATREVHVFKSGNVWYDPERYITASQIEVLIDPANPKRYHLETGFLPKQPK